MADEIVDRLKAEGQLTRNSDTNSIKSVKIQLERFEEVFQTISNNVALQVDLLSSINGSIIEVNKNADEQLKIVKEDREKQEYLRQQEALKADRSDLPSRTTGQFGSGLIDSFRGGVSSFLNKLLIGALFAGGIYALGNVFKGFIESKIGESEFTKGLVSTISWTAIGALFGKKFGLLLGAGNILSKIFDLPEVVKKIGDAFNAEFTDKQSGAIGTALGAALMTAWLRKGGIRAAILGGLLVATGALAENLKDWLVNKADVDPDWADITVDVASLGIQGALLGARLGRLGGLPGAIAGALAGLAIGLGAKLIRWLRDRKEDASERFYEDVESIQPLLDKALRGETLTDEEMKDLARVQTKAERRTGPGGLPVSEEEQQLAEQTLEDINQARAKQPLAPAGGRNTDIQYADRVKTALTADDPQAAQDALNDLYEVVTQSETRPRRIEREMKDFLFGVPNIQQFGLDVNQVFHEWNQLVEDFLKQKGIDTDSASLPQSIDRGRGREPIILEVDEDKNFKRGTEGFQDFGDASFAILHGKEAVVPEETPAGRFLGQHFNDDWTPKMAPSTNNVEKITQASSMSAFNMPVIVNNSPVIAPVTNNVQGGPSINTTNMFGGSGGIRFGLTSAVN